MRETLELYKIERTETIKQKIWKGDAGERQVQVAHMLYSVIMLQEVLGTSSKLPH